jgi:xylulokinase
VLRPAVALELRLPAGIPVVVGAADTPAGLLGAGLVRKDAFLLTISTGATLAVPSAEADPDPSGRSHTFCSALPPEPESAGWYRMAAILSAGLALRWLRDSVFALAGPDAYGEMLSWAATVPPGSRGLVFLPYLAGERNPHMDPTARGAFLGLTASHGRAELVRAVVEGITMGCFDASRALADALRLPSLIILGGGGGRSAVWQHIVADVFGLPVRHLETGEQAALGACLLAGAGAAVLEPASAARRWGRLGPLVEPDAARRETYALVYEIFRDGYPKMRGDFERLRSLPA